MSQSRPDHVTWRHRLLALLLLVAFAAVAVRLVQVQVLDHGQYLEQAAVARLGAAEVPAPRGTILDATGHPLAISIDTWDLYIDRFLWRDRARALVAAAGLAEALGRSADELLWLGTSADAGDVLVARDMAYDAGLQLRDRELWGVRLIPSTVRVYPEGDLAGSLVGYVGLDDQGLWGIEADFNHVLEGRAGWVSMERDPFGRPIAFSPRNERAPRPGGEIQLTIDRFIQDIAERRLEQALKEYGAPSGSIVVMNPHTGAVLAMASWPSISLSNVDLSDPDLPERIRITPVTDLYEPGSVLKTLTTAAAIDLGLVTPDSTYVDEGVVTVGGYEIRNWDLAAHGETTVREYLQRSLNTGAVWLATEIGANDFYRYLSAFGLGEPSHVGLSGEAEGLVRTPDDPEWYPVDLATNSYGQGLAVTPLQVLTALNVFANGGRLMRPYIVSKIVTGDSTRTLEPVEVRRVVSPETARTVAGLMRDVVEGQPWHRARVPGYEVAGKTGTTLVSIPTGYDLNTTIASFAGFIPFEEPAVSILVKIDQPGGDRNLGGEVAAPVFARVAGDIMEYLEIPPSAPAGTPEADQ